jgi:signal transduction histidine kinase
MDFSTVAHDLRSPLHVMLGHMQLLAGEHLSDTGRQRLGMLEAQIHRMMRLLEGLGDQAIRGEHGGTVEIGELIGNLVSELEPVLQARGIEITSRVESGLPVVSGDTDSLYRVLLNVVTNAAESIAGAGAIVITAQVEQRFSSGPGIHVNVADTGRGIPLALLAHVFERGFTTKPSDAPRGLGLNICREIVEMHAGHMHLASVPGAGTTVHLFLPANAH